MLKLVFLTLFIYISNFFKVKLPRNFYGFLKKNNKEYIAFENDVYRSYSYAVKVEYDNVTVGEKKYFNRANYNDNTFDILIIDNNLVFYGLMFNVLVEYNGKTSNIVWRRHILDMIRYATLAFSNECLLICTWTYNFSLNHYERYDFHLHLVKAPYIEISKELDIDTLEENFNFNLIGLKDYFVYIKIDEKEEGRRNITYKFVDLDLNFIDSLTKEYENYSEIYFFQLSNSGKVNEFMMCILKEEDISENFNLYKCQVIKYQNNDLRILQTINIPIISGFYLTTYFFDENKIIFYLYGNVFNSDNNYINILQYENQVLSFYKNFKNLTLPKFMYYYGYYYYFQVDFAMTEQGLAFKLDNELYYLSSICVPKTIILYANKLLEFPIEEFIFPGVDSLRFSFEEFSDFIAIYKNSTEIQKGQIFDDLNNFTYFLKIDTVYKDIKLKVKNHEFDFICSINIDVYIDTNISTYKESKKCFKNNDYNEINNIVYSNLYDYFTIKNERSIKIEFIMEKKPKGNELKFYFDNHFQDDYFDDHNYLLCTSNSTKIICDNIPIFILPKLKRIHLYSYLSCYNLIDVGWFELNHKDVFDIYSLINYDFDTISEIYDPRRNITEYNPAMINYYYWFSCLSYCDDIKIEKKQCCNNILDKWEIVFHKEYKYKKGVLDLIIDKLYDLIEMLVKKVKKSNNDSPSSSSREPINGKSDRPNTESNYNINDDTDIVEHIINILRKLIYLKNKILSPVNNTGSVPSFINLNVNGKNLILNINIKKLVKSLTRLVYQYNFVILKNNEYKKIVVVFPGSSTYLQILDEIIYEELEDLPIADEKQHYYVMNYYYQIFKTIKEDLFNNLKSLTGINEKDYQVIFTGHSIGGAVASISSFFYNKKYKFTAQNILITFGQPRVGSERFAKELTNIMNNQIYRIARPNDIATLFPMKDIDYLVKYIKTLMLGFDFIKFCIHLGMTADILGAIKTAFKFVLNIGDFKEENWYYI